MATQKPEGFETPSIETEALSDRELKVGYWYVTHREAFQKFGIGLLVLVIALTFGYVIFSISRFYIFQYAEYQQALQTAPDDFVNIQAIRQANQIQPIEIISRHVLSSGPGKIDIAALVRNPNPQWALRSVQYQFALGGEFYERQSGFLLPGEEKYFVALNEDGFTSGTPQIFFEEERWQRVTKFEEWGPQRTNFTITDKRFTSARQSELSGRLPISEVSAALTNQTAYNYQVMDVQFALFSGNRLAGINQITLQQVSSGETRPILSRWTESLPSISTVEIVPSVNIVDENAYFGFEGEVIP